MTDKIEMKLIFLIELIFCVQKVFYVLTFKVQMREIQNYEHFHVGQVFAYNNKVNSYEKIIYERYFSPHYQNLCLFLGYTIEGSQVFPCGIAGFITILF